MLEQLAFVPRFPHAVEAVVHDFLANERARDDDGDVHAGALEIRKGGGIGAVAVRNRSIKGLFVVG